DMAKARGDSEAVTQYLLNLGMACAEKGDNVRAESVLRKALQRGVRDPFYLAVAANNLSYLNNSAGHFAEAERFARQALAAHAETRSLLLAVHAKTNLGKALIGQKRFAEAARLLEEVVRLARENQFEHELMEGLWNLAAAYEGTGRYAQALQALRRYSDSRDTLLTRENARQINELRVKYETEKKEQEIVLRTQQLHMARMKLRFAVVVVALALGSALVVANLYVKRTLAYRELVKRNLELVRSERRISDLEKHAAERSAATSRGMSDRTRAKLIRELDRVFREERVHLKPDLTLEKLAARMGVSSRYLSQVVREHYGTSFPSLVNNLRISEARRMLADEKYQHYSIEGIARTVGFSSKSAFNVAFKKITGITPSFFRNSVAQHLDQTSEDFPA
ncbi:MAG: helix-turn-helix domain-containing protein, partial [Calditrichaeota bacterium]|nr:helix-turn-helix domain-containing protein [Calditrichota bacterium]